MMYRLKGNPYYVEKYTVQLYLAGISYQVTPRGDYAEVFFYDSAGPEPDPEALYRESATSIVRNP